MTEAKKNRSASKHDKNHQPQTDEWTDERFRIALELTADEFIDREESRTGRAAEIALPRRRVRVWLCAPILLVIAVCVIYFRLGRFALAFALTVLLLGVLSMVFLLFVYRLPKVYRISRLCHPDSAKRKLYLQHWLQQLPDRPNLTRTNVGKHMLGPWADQMVPAWLPYAEKRRLLRLVRTLRDDARREATEGWSHAEAKRLLLDRLERSQPFALYLRGFSCEAKTKEYCETGAVTFFSPDRGDEQAVYDAVHDSLPVVGIVNPVDFAAPGLIPKLDVPDEIWELVVAILIELAAVVIVSAKVISPGLLLELARIKYLKKYDSTVIITKPGKEEPINWGQFALHVVSDAQSLREVVTKLSSTMEPALSRPEL